VKLDKQTLAKYGIGIYLLSIFLAGCTAWPVLPLGALVYEEVKDYRLLNARNFSALAGAGNLQEKIVGTWLIKQGILDGCQLTFYQNGIAVVHPIEGCRERIYFVTDYTVLDGRRISFVDWGYGGQAIATFITPRESLVLLQIDAENNGQTFVLENHQVVQPSPKAKPEDVIVGTWVFDGVYGSYIFEFLENGKLLFASFSKETGFFGGGIEGDFTVASDNTLQIIPLHSSESVTQTLRFVLPEENTFVFRPSVEGWPGIFGRDMLPIGKRKSDFTMYPTNLEQTILGLWAFEDRGPDGSETFEFFEDGTLLYTHFSSEISVETYTVTGDNLISFVFSGTEYEMRVFRLEDGLLGLSSLDGMGESFQLRRN